MKHKGGDKVRVKSKEWWGLNKEFYREDDCFYLETTAGIFFSEKMFKYLGKSLVIDVVLDDRYNCKGNIYSWTDMMFEKEPEEDKPTKRNIEDNLWICRMCKDNAHEYFRVSPERMEEMKNEWEERLQSGDYVQE